MSKNVHDGNEMQTISVSVDHSVNNDFSTFSQLASNQMNGNVTSNQESTNVQKRDAWEQYGLSRNPSIQSSIPPRKNSTKISYLNEKEMNSEKNHFQGQKPDHVLISGKSQYKESPLAYQPFDARRMDYSHRGSESVLNNNLITNRLTNGGRAVAKGISPNRIVDRSTQYHTFLADAADVRQIEGGLLKLMEEFQTGNLRAFGKDSRLRQMEEIREQQERLAKLHFDVGAEQDSYPPLSEDGLRVSDQNMKTLMEKLADLSESIENLHTNSTERKSSVNERRTGSLEKKPPTGSERNGAGGGSDQRSNAFPLLNGGDKELTLRGVCAKVDVVHPA